MPRADDSCPLPRERDDESAAIAQMLAATRIAIVGASDNPTRASNRIAVYLLDQGKQVIVVNPNHSSVLGSKCYRSLSVAPGPIDLVNVFRRSEFCEDVAREAVKIGANGLWLQSGIVNEAALKLARENGLLVVQDRCIVIEHLRRR